MRIGKLPAAALILLASGMSARAEPIGATLKIVNLVTAEFNRDTRSLAQGDGINQDELIEVGSDALGELVFKDETKLALGPGSKMKLDKFVYDPEKSTGSIVVNLVKGTFRFITGVADKPTYTIRTPAASITVRGTIFDVAILDDGTTWLLLHEGAVAVSNQRGKCNLLSSPGRLIRVTGNGDVGIPVNWNGMPGRDRVEFDQAFPFVAEPPSMDPKPVFTRAAVLAIPAGGGQTSQSCDEKGEEPTTPAPRRADDGDDSRPAKQQKPVRRAVDDNDYVKPKTKKPVRETKTYDPPIKVVVPIKPKKKKPGYGDKYGDKDDNVKVMDGIGIAIGVGGALGKMKGGHKGPSRGEGGYGGKGMDGGGYGGKMTPH